MGSVAVGTAEDTPREGGLSMTPVGSYRSASAPLPPAFEVRCADIHPGSCQQVLRAPRPGEVVALACEHGKLVHGFTAVWYSPQRLAVMAAAVTWPTGGTR